MLRVAMADDAILRSHAPRLERSVHTTLYFLSWLRIVEPKQTHGLVSRLGQWVGKVQTSLLTAQFPVHVGKKSYFFTIGMPAMTAVLW